MLNTNTYDGFIIVSRYLIAFTSNSNAIFVKLPIIINNHELCYVTYQHLADTIKRERAFNNCVSFLGQQLILL